MCVYDGCVGGLARKKNTINHVTHATRWTHPVGAGRLLAQGALRAQLRDALLRRRARHGVEEHLGQGGRRVARRVGEQEEGVARHGQGEGREAVQALAVLEALHEKAARGEERGVVGRRCGVRGGGREGPDLDAREREDEEPRVLRAVAHGGAEHEAAEAQLGHGAHDGGPGSPCLSVETQRGDA